MTTWRKSSYSGSQTDCVEVGTAWRKSSYSGNGGEACIEAGNAPGRVLVRDTKQDGDGPVVSVNPPAWRRFTASIRANAAIC
jgi:hypothetical protein